MEVVILIFLVVDFSLNQILLVFLLYVRQIWKTQWTVAISLWGVIFLWFERILLLICMVLHFMWRADFLFAWDLLIENSEYSYLSFWLPLLHSASYFFFLYQSSFSSLCKVFYAISSNTDKVLPINPSADVFVFGDFLILHMGWLTYSGGTVRPAERCYNFI